MILEHQIIILMISERKISFAIYPK